MNPKKANSSHAERNFKKYSNPSRKSYYAAEFCKCNNLKRSLIRSLIGLEDHESGNTVLNSDGI